MSRIRIYPDSEAVAAAAADLIVTTIEEVLEERSRCSVVLPGGTTPARALELMSAAELPWDRIHWYPGDERCVALGDDERNDSMIRAMLQPPQGSELRLHPIPAELGAEQAVQQYTPQIESVGRFDIVVLGMGEDGHTASLFPGNPALHDPAAVVAVHDSPKPPPDRVSLGMSVLAAASHRIVIATGAGKRDVIEAAIFGDELPISRFGADTWLLDRGICTGIESIEKKSVKH